MEINTVSNEDSILETVKKLLGIGAEYEAFDVDVMSYINAAFLDLQQIGVGPEQGFMIEDKSAKWSDFIQDELILNSVKPYIYLKVKLIFDPPNSSSVMTSMEKLIDRFEWRINIAAESSKDSGKEDSQNDRS